MHMADGDFRVNSRVDHGGCCLFRFCCSGLLLKPLVGTVTKRAACIMLAGAEVDRDVLLSGIRLGGKIGALVGAVAERLGFALAAGTPMVSLASFDSKSDGRGLSDFWCFHFVCWFNGLLLTAAAMHCVQKTQPSQGVLKNCWNNLFSPATRQG